MPDWLRKKEATKSVAILLSMLLLLILLGKPVISKAQQAAKQGLTNDTVYRYFPEHSPVKATWMSAALPGLGQYYNGKYWKIPIIYAGFSTFAYFVIQNRYEYNRFKEAYAISVELPEGQESTNPLVQNYSSDQLLSQREYYQSSLEMSYILTGIFYILQIVDATVDAHLYDYNIDDDLSIHLAPQMMPTVNGPRMAPGIGITYKLSRE